MACVKNFAATVTLNVYVYQSRVYEIDDYRLVFSFNFIITQNS